MRRNFFFAKARESRKPHDSLQPILKQRGRTSPKVRELLARLRSVGPMLQGSVYEAFTRCSRSTCACHTEDKKHATMRLSWNESGRTRTLRIPRDLLEEVQEWVDEWKRVKELVREVSEEQREFLRAIKRRRGPGRPRKVSSKPSS